jgi:hypothetical protein
MLAYYSLSHIQIMEFVQIQILFTRIKKTVMLLEIEKAVQSIPSNIMKPIMPLNIISVYHAKGFKFVCDLV